MFKILALLSAEEVKFESIPQSHNSTGCGFRLKLPRAKQKFSQTTSILLWIHWPNEHLLPHGVQILFASFRVN